jgi:hypothetical protein
MKSNKFCFLFQGSLSKRPSRDGHMGGNRDQTNKRPSMMMMPPPKIIDVKIEKVELHQTENAWKPGKYKEDTTNGESQVCQSFFRIYSQHSKTRQSGFPVVFLGQNLCPVFKWFFSHSQTEPKY